MTDLIHPRPSWLRETLTLLRACWRPLLAIMVVTELVALLAVGALLLSFNGGAGNAFSGLDGPAAVASFYVLPAVLAGACHAWSWAAAVQVIQGAVEGRRVRFGEALRRGVRRSGPLALWLGGVGLIRAAGSMYLFHVMTDYPSAMSGFQTASDVLTVGGWYLSFAVALLAPVVLFERRGPVRAWRLAHSRAATIGQIVAVLVFGLAVDYLADFALTWVVQADLMYTWPLSLRVATDSILGVLTSTVTMTALTVAYLHRVALPTSPARPATDPGPSGSEPVVIELGRTW